MQVQRSYDVVDFWSQVAPWLAIDPVANNVASTLLSARSSGRTPVEAGIVLARIVDPAGQIQGTAIRTPPHPMLVSALPEEAIDALAAFVHGHLPEVTGFNGPAGTVEALAHAVAELRGAEAHVESEMGRFRLDQVIAPELPSGAPRPASLEDLDDALRLATAFFIDSALSGAGMEADVRARVRRGLLWLWCDDGAPVSMAAMTEPAAGVSRVSLVYTPPAARGRGYASALVAHLSQRILDSGNIATLFTDLSNPTSNKIYREIGFRFVDKAAHWRLLSL